ncbi:hypothetical protein CCHR01_12871 [Colletotrichum chrysophilum]|uniref:Uncharacterized protein n=1 Tax=Colletotrichum chrysophilum TaxID=1836956 RepID=A0AAD9AAE7_9PEZI|nr:hypothetical protein CCHR01_12871 [Colletotrichum chrysophilum]
MSSLSRAHEVHNAADTVMPLIHDHSTSGAPGDAEENLTSSTCTKTQNGDHAHRQRQFRAASAGFTSFALSLLIFPLVSGWLSLERPGHESIFERNLTWAPLVSAVRWSDPDALLVLLFLALYAVSTFSFRSARCHDPWQDVIIAVFLSSGFFVVVTVVVLKGQWADVFDGLFIVVPPLIPLGIWFSIAIHMFSRQTAWICRESRDQEL